MPDDVNQHQRSGDQSINVQSGRDVTITTGLSVTEARQIALDVFNANFLRLSDTARQIASERAAEITDKFIRELSARNPNALNAAQDPDMQSALFTAQREYARSGDHDLADVLVDILVDRAAEQSRTLLQIVLNEAIAVVPKLPAEQLDVLSLVFTVRYTRSKGINSLASFHDYLNVTIVPFLTSLPPSRTTFQHLEYAGCGTMQITHVSVEDRWRKGYSGLFCKGLPKAEVDRLIASEGAFPELFTSCLHAPELFQFNAIDDETLNEVLASKALEPNQIANLRAIRNNNVMSDGEIKLYLLRTIPELEPLFKAFEHPGMGQLTLTSVGIAIGHANIRRRTGAHFDLSIWIK